MANGCSIDHPGAISTPECNLSRACNIGISASHGDYIVRLDADDWLDAELLKAEAEHLDNSPHLDCVWCDYLTAQKRTEGEDFEVFLLSHLPQENLEHACGAMFRKSVWEDLGGYDEDLEYQEAFDFWCRFEQHGYQAARIERPMYLYRRGHQSMSTNPERDEVRKMLEDKYGVQEKEA